jgi:hypothetical protein
VIWQRLKPRDRVGRQRGSVLSALLIIVAFLSILVGALMTELTTSFLISGTLVTRMQREATVSSGVELGIHQLQTTAVPPVCVRDARGPWFVTLNSNSAAVTKICAAIVPDLATGLASGDFVIDGVHDTTAGRDMYLVSDSAGDLRGYVFGQTTARWSVPIGGPPTASPLPMVDADGRALLLLPEAMSGLGCGGHCVSSFHNSGGAPSFHCTMPASTNVDWAPAVETSAGGFRNFPDYAFFGGSGLNGQLYVYDAADDHDCAQLASAALGGGSAGAPLVFPGTVSQKSGVTTTSDEIFVLVSNGSNTSLEQWSFEQSVDSAGNTSSALVEVNALLLTNQVGGAAAGYAISSKTPVPGTSLTLAVAGAAGRVATAWISVGLGPSYAMVRGSSAVLPGGISRPPYWCHCPGQDLIGLGSTNGVLYLLNGSLAIQWSYDGQADGRPAINSTPSADANGDWYFGANDGFVYDVEIPTTGQQMFKAARFGPGGAILSSPVVGAPVDGCSSGPCLYFASGTAGSYFVGLGSTRIFDLRACISTASDSTTCAANPRVWARVEIGSSVVIGEQGVYVQGWSYYSP